MARLITFFLFLAGIGFIVYQIAMFFVGINATTGQLKRDIVELTDLLKSLTASLIPLDTEELSLLSLNHKVEINKRGLNPVKLGVFKSIYHEPLISFAIKEYGGHDRASIIIKTKTTTFAYQVRGLKTELNIDGVAIGSINHKGLLYSKEKKKLLGSIDTNESQASQSIYIGDKEIGIVVNPLLESSQNKRAIEQVDKLDLYDQQIFLSLSLLNLVQRSVE